jgi:hypothetical protein
MYPPVATILPSPCTVTLLAERAGTSCVVGPPHGWTLNGPAR